ncbi:hypothetical protein Tco_0976599 [Tanacetum coccineum]|uniref:Uncharacterized protein n=1 Tax=Tanacetum coccineum TaxID=301880 RepID=A0ABQ5EIW0_9ASTR
MQFSKETLHEKDSNSELRWIKGSFEHFIHSKMFELSKYNTNAREILQDFNAYTTMEAQTFKETIIQNMDSIAQCMVERASHEQELKMTLKRTNHDETCRALGRLLFVEIVADCTSVTNRMRLRSTKPVMTDYWL